MTQAALFEGGAAHDPGCKRLMRVPPSWAVETEFGGPGHCYRYKLLHQWGAGEKLLWLMTNPSGANGHLLDSTVSKTSQIAKYLRFGGQFIANACAYRATDPKRLLEVEDPVGPRNEAAILEMAADSAMIIVAHGHLPGKLQHHARAICNRLQGAGYILHALRLSQDGTPMHPLSRGKGFIPVETEPFVWSA